MKDIVGLACYNSDQIGLLLYGFERDSYQSHKNNQDLQITLPHQMSLKEPVLDKFGENRGVGGLIPGVSLVLVWTTDPNTRHVSCCRSNNQD